MSFRIRSALPSDGAALAAIYAPYIDTVISFESPAPTAEEFSGRIADISAEYPFLVCEEDGRAVGYAYAHRYRVRAAFDWDAELSVYLEQSYTGRGLGMALYSALLSCCGSRALSASMEPYPRPIRPASGCMSVSALPRYTRI